MTIMSTLIEVISPFSTIEAVQSVVEQCCEETGDLPIGRRIYEETNEVLLVVQLLHTTNTSKHINKLNNSLQQRLIVSFRCLTRDLVKIFFNSSVNLQEQMSDFPLLPGESWFPAIYNPHQAYVYLHKPLMSTKQAAWLAMRDVKWVYI